MSLEMIFYRTLNEYDIRTYVYNYFAFVYIIFFPRTKTIYTKAN